MSQDQKVNLFVVGLAAMLKITSLVTLALFILCNVGDPHRKPVEGWAIFSVFICFVGSEILKAQSHD